MNSYDVAVIGSGPGGYVAAIRCAQLGMKTAVVEAADLGGICLNWGCIPTKALLRSSEIYHLLDNLDAHGITVGEVSFDLSKMIARSRKVAKRLVVGVKHLLLFDAREKIAATGVHRGILRDAGDEFVLLDQAYGAEAA